MLARRLLETGVEDGDDEVLDAAIKIAHTEGLDVTFRVEGGETVFTPALAFRVRYDRGLDIRYPR